MPQEKGERKTFVRESSFLIYKFFEIYKIEKHCVIFTDASNAFFNKKVDVYFSMGQIHLCSRDEPTVMAVLNNDAAPAQLAAEAANSYAETVMDATSATTQSIYDLDS